MKLKSWLSLFVRYYFIVLYYCKKPGWSSRLLNFMENTNPDLEIICRGLLDHFTEK